MTEEQRPASSAMASSRTVVEAPRPRGTTPGRERLTGGEKCSDEGAVPRGLMGLRAVGGWRVQLFGS